MKLIAITTPFFYEGEAEAIAEILRGGRFCRVHIRKPESTQEEMRRLLDAIPHDLRPQLTLHDHSGLATEYGIGGVHLNSRNPLSPAGWKGLTSRSIHTIVEIAAIGEDCAYAFISPVFPSISKPGYRSTFTLDELIPHLTPRIYALGGVTPDRLPALEEAGFGGAAMLGAAWRRSICMDAFRLQLITNGATVEQTVEGARKAVAGGCRWVQIRMKDTPVEDVERAAIALAPLRQSHGITLIVDDHVELATRMDCIDGVHVGKNDMPVAEARRMLGPAKILGATANTYADLANAARQGADYAGVGPFRFTTTKKNLSPVLGTVGYRDIMSRCRRDGLCIPVVAIGGITPGDIPGILSTGVSGIAASGTILRAADPAAATTEILNIINLPDNG